MLRMRGGCRERGDAFWGAWGVQKAETPPTGELLHPRLVPELG